MAAYATFHKLKKKLPFILGITVILISISLFISLSGIFAQNQISAQSLEVSPPSQEVSVNPGQKVLVRSKIRNRSNATLPIRVHIEDFTAQGEEGQIALEVNSKYSLSTWAKITPSSFELPPGQEQEVAAEITVPADKVAGGFYGSFIYKVVTSQQGGAASIGQEIASLFLMKVNGQIDEKLFLNQFSAPGFQEFGPVPFSLKFTNTGNVHTKPFGLINVSDMFGNKVTDIVVTGNNVFPGASRILKANLNKTFLIGRYTATAIMYYGSIKNDTLTAVTSFVVFPVRIVAGLILLCVIFYLLRKRIRKAFKALFG